MQERLKRAIQQVARPPHLDFLALYPATVLKDYGDMHVDVRADDERLSTLTRVPIWLGLPGATVEVAAGARVLIGFHLGDPEQCYCDLWRGEGLTKLRIEASAEVEVIAPTVKMNGESTILAGGGPPVARVGDDVLVAGIVGKIISGSSKTTSG